MQNAVKCGSLSAWLFSGIVSNAIRCDREKKFFHISSWNKWLRFWVSWLYSGIVLKTKDLRDFVCWTVPPLENAASFTNMLDTNDVVARTIIFRDFYLVWITVPLFECLKNCGRPGRRVPFLSRLGFKHSSKCYTAARVSGLSEKLVGLGGHWVVSGIWPKSIIAAMFVYSRLSHNFVLKNKEISLRRGLLCVAVVQEGENGSVVFSFLSCDNCLVWLYRRISYDAFPRY